MSANVLTHLKSDTSIYFESRENNNMGCQIYLRKGIQIYILKPREGEQTRKYISLTRDTNAYYEREWQH